MKMEGMGPEKGMEMMKKMTGGEGGGPMEKGMAMCKEMMASIKSLSQTTALAALAEAVGLAPETTAHLLGRMAAAGKITMQAQRVPTDG